MSEYVNIKKTSLNETSRALVRETIYTPALYKKLYGNTQPFSKETKQFPSKRHYRQNLDIFNDTGVDGLLESRVRDSKNGIWFAGGPSTGTFIQIIA
jgi:hypothetical protein